jgi:cyclophilin family peptidyl-prolyl cis-trans isomerase
MTPAPIRRSRRPATLVALVALVTIALAACSSAASPAPTALPTMPPVTPPPAATPASSSAAAGSPGASVDLSKCPTSADQITALKPGETKTVTLDTSAGKIVTQVSGDLAPIAAGNFVALAECGYYDGVVFHRVVPDFVIQAGDGQYARVPIANPDHMGVGGPGYQFKDEPVVGDYLRGTLAMANAGADTNGSQFFICLADLPTLPKSYTIFGKVTQGMDVVDKIAAAPQTPPDANGNTRPVDPVVISTATVSQ